jgi:hypothetical protein
LGYIALEQPCFCKIVIVFAISGMYIDRTLQYANRSIRSVLLD